MTDKKVTPAAVAPAPDLACESASEARATRRSTMIAMMREPEGATAAELGATVGWQRHSVRGFIAGTLKKRPGVEVLTKRSEAGTRYWLVDRAEA